MCQAAVLLFAAALFAGAAACADIDVAVGTGGDTGHPPSDAASPQDGGGGADAGGPGPDAGGPGPDTGGPGPDTGGPGPDTGGPGPDTGGPGPDSGGPEDTPVGPEDTPTPLDAVEDVGLPPCVDELLDPAWGAAVATAFTLEGDDDFAGSCGGADSKDFAYGWVVPFTDWFVLDTAGSDFDTVLYVREGCEGPELECHNDRSATDDTSQIVRRFEKDERRVVVLDGNSGSSGNAVLNIQPVRCPSADVGGGGNLPQQYSTASGTQEHDGTCGGDTGPERAFRFTPPEDGLWRITSTAVAGEVLETALYLERGPMCGGPLLQCNGHDFAYTQMPAEVVRLLPAGLPVTVVVDSRSGGGNFTLNAQKIGDGCPAIPDADIPPDTALNIHDGTDTWTTSCGQNGDVEFSSFQPYPDLLVGFNDLEPGSGAFCRLAVTAGFPFSLGIVRGECAGAEISCQTVDATGGGDGRYHLDADFPRLGGRFMMAVSPIRPEWQGWIDSQVTYVVMCVAK